MTITQIGALSSDIAVIVACAVGVYGLTAWRREHLGKQRIDLAEEVLALFYEARDAIQSIRSPFSFGGEGLTREPRGDETPEQKEARDRAHIVFERHKRYKEVFNRLNTVRYRFVAKFGSSTSQPFEELDRSLNKVFSSARILAQLWAERIGPGAPDERLQQYARDLERHERIFWSGYDENDEIERRLQTAVGEMERFARDVIDNPGVLRRVMRRLGRRRHSAPDTSTNE